MPGQNNKITPMKATPSPPPTKQANAITAPPKPNLPPKTITAPPKPNLPPKTPSATSTLSPKPQKSALKSYSRLKRSVVKARSKNPVYSLRKSNFGEARENRVKEWKPNYKPIISSEPLHNNRRSVSFNPHFWKYPKSKASLKRYKLARYAIVEISLQNGFGGRYKMSPPIRKTFDYPMLTVSKVIFGSGCMKRKLRRKACLEILRDWKHYKFSVKESYSMHIHYFRTYNPLSQDEKVHKHAMFLYKACVYYNMYDSKPLELRVACEMYKHNFYCIESVGEEKFKVVPSFTEFDRSIYFFANEIPYQGKIVDIEANHYRNYCLTWLDPLIPSSRNLQIGLCVLRSTYVNPDIGYFHLFEEDPEDPVDLFRITNDKKRVRNPYIRFWHTVFGLYYYKRRSFHCWDYCCRCWGCWVSPEIDERILSYHVEQVERYHEYENHFFRMAQRSNYGIPLDKNKRRKISMLTEEFFYEMKSTKINPSPLFMHECERIRKKYVRKHKRARKLYKIRNIRREKLKHPERNYDIIPKYGRGRRNWKKLAKRKRKGT